MRSDNGQLRAKCFTVLTDKLLDYPVYLTKSMHNRSGDINLPTIWWIQCGNVADQSKNYTFSSFLDSFTNPNIFSTSSENPISSIWSASSITTVCILPNYN